MFGVSSLAETAGPHGRGPLRRRRAADGRACVLRRDGAIRDFEMEIRRAGGEIRTVIDSATCARDPETAGGLLPRHPDRHHGSQAARTAPPRPELSATRSRAASTAGSSPSSAPPSGRVRPSFPATWGCIMVDLDYFKHYNDEFGHEAGDAVLNRVARFLMRPTRAEESTVRMGGDEFLLLLDGADAAATEFAARRLQVDRRSRAPRPVLAGLGLARGRRERSRRRSRARTRRLLKSRGRTRSGERPRLVLDGVTSPRPASRPGRGPPASPTRRSRSSAP